MSVAVVAADLLPAHPGYYVGFIDYSAQHYTIQKAKTLIKKEYALILFMPKTDQSVTV